MPTNRSLGTARDLGVLNGSFSPITDAIGTNDEQDFFKFTLSQNSSVNFVLSDLGNDPAQLRLVTDLNGDGLVTSNEIVDLDSILDFSSSTDDRSITASLSAGTYWAEVYRARDSDNTGYTLSGQATARTTDDNPGNTLATALDIGILSSAQTFQDVVDQVDPEDYYKFSLAQNSDVVFSLSGLENEPAQLRLVTDLNGDGLVSTNEVVDLDSILDFSSSTDARSITTSLSAGTYWAEIYTSRDSENSAYELSAQATVRGADNAIDPGNSLIAAPRILNTGASQTFRDVVDQTDPVDYYKFLVFQNSDATLSLTGLGNEPAQLRIVTDTNKDGLISNSEQIAVDSIGDFSSSTDDRSITTTLSPGVYWAEVYTARDRENTAYELNTKITVQPNAPRFPSSAIAWDTSTSVVSSFKIDGGSLIASTTPIGRTIEDTNWKLQTTGDFNGDGQDDVLLRNFVSGQNLFWEMGPLGESITSERLIGRDVADQNWSLSGTGDFDGDGQADIILRNENADQIVAWYMNSDGTIKRESIVGRGFGDNNWKIEAVADFNGDGQADIVLRNGLSGQNLLWTMDESEILGEALIGRTIADPNWQLEGAQDFNGDGTTDLLFRQVGVGQGLLWSMAGPTQIAQELLISNVPTGTSEIVF